MFIDDELYENYESLIKQFHTEGTVLDLGTGTAPLAIKLAKSGYYVTGTDVSTEMLEMAYNNMVEAGVKINLFIHNILDTVNRDYDIITMSSDVINYLKDKDEMVQAFTNVSLAMNDESIFVFDFLRPNYLERINGHYEEILLPDGILKWSVQSTNIDHQVKHIVEIGNEKEIHIEQTYLAKEFNKMLKTSNLHVVKKLKLEERYIYVCKKVM
jgi:SAM-dependent methyltransferase